MMLFTGLMVFTGFTVYINAIFIAVSQELKSKDDLYVKDLKKMAEDVDLMIERMDEQINNVTKAHREELEEIEVG
jgi:dynein regulatory complex protein 1